MAQLGQGSRNFPGFLQSPSHLFATTKKPQLHALRIHSLTGKHAVEMQLPNGDAGDGTRRASKRALRVTLASSGVHVLS